MQGGKRGIYWTWCDVAIEQNLGYREEIVVVDNIKLLAITISFLESCSTSLPMSEVTEHSCIYSARKKCHPVIQDR